MARTPDFVGSARPSAPRIIGLETTGVFEYEKNKEG